MQKPKTPDNKQVTAALAVVLADTYVLAIKSHGHHWNVTGALFKPLHDFLGEQYAALIEAADELAERMRALGAYAPTSMAQLLKLTQITESTALAQSATERLEDLVAAHTVLVGNIQKAKIIATAADDMATDDILNGRREAHDKTLWMLRAQLA
jgi:starvation-inducible DNA-binding protein